MNAITTVSIVEGDQDMLMREAIEHENLINTIKAEVCQDWDNINNPVPVFEMLED